MLSRLCLLTLVVLAPALAVAQDAPEPALRLGELEQQLVDAALQERGLTLAPSPEGARVCEVQVETVEVFTASDPYPLWPNRFHTPTRERVVRALLPIDEGDTWTELLGRDARESLLDPLVFSTAAVVPYAMDDEGCVGVLAVTKDIWSLLLVLSPQVYGSYTETYAGVTETNLLGTNMLVSLLARVEPLRWSTGATLRHRHLWQGRVTWTDWLWVGFDREDGGSLDGVEHGLVLERPLRSSAERWGWLLEQHYASETSRRYEGDEVALYDTGVGEVPERWRERSTWVSGVVRYAHGADHRWVWSVGPFLRDTRAQADPRGEVADEALARFVADRLPRTESVWGPSVSWEIFHNRYAPLTNYDGFGITESVQRGYRVEGRLRYSTSAFADIEGFAEPAALAQYRWIAAEDGVVELGGEVRERRRSTGWSDRAYGAWVRLASPRDWGGRWVGYGATERVDRDTARELWSLGVENGIRGYATGTQLGLNVDRVHLEWRSAPSVRAQTHVGAAVFVDAARVHDDDDLWFASVGAGLRLGMPQLWSTVRSLDIALPLRYGSGVDLGPLGRAPRPVFSLRIGQAF